MPRPISYPFSKFLSSIFPHLSKSPSFPTNPRNILISFWHWKHQSFRLNSSGCNFIIFNIGGVFMKTFFILMISVSLMVWGCGKKETSQTQKPATAQKEASTQPAEAQVGVAVEKPHQIPEDQFTTTPSGLKYADIVVGEGEQPQKGDIVVVHYTGWLTDGKRFDSSVLRGKPFKFPLGMHRVIAGWDEGVASMRVGGVRQLIIPPELAYGSRGAGGVIPPNATLIFEVQMLGIEKPQQK